MQLNVGDSVGGIYKKSKNGEDFWEMVEGILLRPDSIL